ncbi:hypothetical protein [Jiella pacifica]|uniref:Uncharacterized protein n=1 Tax=Jiella pacifica TaxID=2696469 RepID=A0A6N9T9Y5_9HYPH|nr:hypothetical protein [Jiella pacifica]NDW07362.1 hypothetical protein [Jiella pacifica]
MREKDIRTIEMLDGIPGDAGSEETATELLVQVVRRLGYGALSDAGLEALAAAHREHDDNRR